MVLNEHDIYLPLFEVFMFYQGPQVLLISSLPSLVNQENKKEIQVGGYFGVRVLPIFYKILIERPYFPNIQKGKNLNKHPYSLDYNDKGQES